MADVDARATDDAVHAMRADPAREPDDPQVVAGSAVFALSMLVWASGNLIHDDTVVGAWAMFILGGIGAWIGLGLAVGYRVGAREQPPTPWLLPSLSAMFVLVGISSTMDGAMRTIAVSIGVTLLVVGFVHAMAQLRAAQQQLAELTVVEERQRVAADVHDIVGHALAVTMLHINAARLSLPDRPDAAIESLEEAERHGRSSMNEIRSVVRLLRVDDTTNRQRLPEFGDIPALVERLAVADRQIDFDDRIERGRQLPTSVSVTLYRLTQEGLTNAIRYGTGRIEVSLEATDEDVTLEIVNHVDGPAERVGGGVGLAAADTRVASVGGTFEAGPVDDGRWRLRAQLPT